MSFLPKLSFSRKKIINFSILKKFPAEKTIKNSFIEPSKMHCFKSWKAESMPVVAGRLVFCPWKRFCAKFAIMKTLKESIEKFLSKRIQLLNALPFFPEVSAKRSFALCLNHLSSNECSNWDINLCAIAVNRLFKFQTD